jgi:hypothetical protein
MYLNALPPLLYADIICVVKLGDISPYIYRTLLDTELVLAT